jgi:hypothetical protein
MRDAAVGLDDNDCAMCAAWFTDHEACVGADAVANLEDLLDAAKELADARGVGLTLPVEEIRALLSGPS